MQQYYAVVSTRRRNNGIVSEKTYQAGANSIRKFLEYAGTPVTRTALSELIAETRRQHREDDFSTDDALLRFVTQKPIILHASYGSYIKGVFRANRCPLTASFNSHFTHPTKKISAGILKAIYQSLDTEHRALMDFQAYAGERVSAICRKTPLDRWEDYDSYYTLVHIKAEDTKARNAHICIIPKELADWIRNYAKRRADNGYPNTNSPFPNHETLWKDITQLATSKFGTHITSHYLRKRFHTIAGKTAMPVNSWDYLMGDKQSHGHEATTYTLEDFSELVKEYSKYLAPYLSIGNPKEPDESKEPTKDYEQEQLRRENARLKDQLLKLTQFITQNLGRA